MTVGTTTVVTRPGASGLVERVRAALAASPVAVVLAASVPLAALIARVGVWATPTGGTNVSLFDDAMISMSYGRTLAETGELVWFPGAGRVEGVTNLGWTLVMAGLHRLGLPGDAVAVVVMALGLGVVWLTALAARPLVRAVAGTTSAQTDRWAVAAVALSFPLLWWSVRGMEVGVITLLVVLAAQRALTIADRGLTARDATVLAVVLAAGVLVRTDFAVVAAGVGLWLLVERGVRDRIRAVVLVGGATAVTLAVGVAARLWYYGDPFPNTFYLKLTGVGLVARLERGGWAALLTFLIYLAGPALVVAAGWRCWLADPGRRAARLLLVVAGLGAAYSVYVGGDAWEYFLTPNRYLTSSLVLLSLVAAGVLTSPAADADDRVPPPSSRRRLALGVALVGLGPLVGHGLVTAFPRTDLAVAAGIDRRYWAVVALPLLVAALAVVALLARRVYAGDGHRRLALGAAFGLGLAASAVALPGLTFDDVDDGSLHARYGEQVAAVTTPEAVVAFSAAGGPQYFADRPAVDLLGKSDEVVAHEPPADPSITWPGHDKDDYAHSLGDLRPDVVAHVSAGLSVDDLLAWGYRPYALRAGSFVISASRACGVPALWAQPVSPAVRFDRLSPVDPASCG